MGQSGLDVSIFFSPFSTTTFTDPHDSFQEYLASPRRLIFANGQVTFKCSWDAPFREDIESEYQFFGIHDYIYHLNGTMPERWLLKSIGPVSYNLVRLLTQMYSDRDLSQQSDALNAFAGLAAMVKTDSGIELCYGLIWTALTLSMMWNPKASFARRSGFPSWSWCGWVGSIQYPSEPSGSSSAWTTRYAWIGWYLYDGEGGFAHVPQKRSGLGR
jgi:hypothetical protein